MKPTTQCALAVRHVGKSDESVQCFTGTSAEVVLALAKYIGSIYLATRLDMCLARSEEEARGGLIVGRKRNEIPQELNIENLTRLMDSASSEATGRDSLTIENPIHGAAE